MRTLAEINAKKYTWTWSDTYVVEDSAAVGSQGPAGTGQKIHRLTLTTIVQVLKADAPRKVGDQFAVQAYCNRNGTFTGRVYDNLDTADITCKRCGG